MPTLYRNAPKWTGHATIPSAYALACGDILSLPHGVQLDIPSPSAYAPYRVLRRDGDACQHFKTYDAALRRARALTVTP